MVLMPFSETAMLDESTRRILLEVAWESIRHGLVKGVPIRPDPVEYPEPLRAHRAAFVTLHRSGDLRGCIGHLEPCQPLVLDVAENAFAAALRDPRFPRLEPRELSELTLHISVLSIPEPMSFRDEQDLLRQLRPGIDGLILADRGARGTFLPAVWESLPEPRDFLNHLKYKAGLPGNHWSKTLQILRYHTEAFGS
jgi:AmmeMemoRadiSam system protein A